MENLNTNPLINSKPLVFNGPLLINPSRILWANTEAMLVRPGKASYTGEAGVEIQFADQQGTVKFFDGDAGAACSILLASAVEATNA